MKNVIGAVLAGLGIGALGAGVGVGAVLLLIISILLKPVVAIGVGFVVGFGLKLIAGNFVAGALATILHATITASTLPQIFAGLTLLSAYIKPNARNNGGAEVKFDLKDEIKKARNSK